MLAESNETQKFVVQSLAAALAKAKKSAEERERIYDLRLRDLDGTNELPDVEINDMTHDDLHVMQNEVAKQ